MTINTEQLEALAQRLFDAFVAHDLDAARAMLHPDARIVQNGAANDVPTALAGIAAIRTLIGEHRYEDIRRVTGANVVVEEHHVVSTTPSGDPVDLAACVVIRVDDDGLIIEIDEYVDLSTFPMPRG